MPQTLFGITPDSTASLHVIATLDHHQFEFLILYLEFVKIFPPRLIFLDYKILLFLLDKIHEV